MSCPLFAHPPRIQAASPSFMTISSTPITIASIEVLRVKRGRLSIPAIYPRGQQEVYFIRSQSTEGCVGYSVAHERIKYFFPILQKLVIPYFIGKDIRDLETLIDEVYVFRSNYKLSGLALWCCVAWVEMSLLDLLGKQTHQSIAQLLGGTPQSEVPIYLSSLRRDTTPEVEIDLIGQRLAETGAKAVKFKIGGRMNQEVDSIPHRTEQLIQRARQILPSAIAIGVDGNGSYSAQQAIEMGHFLENYGVTFFEEPCPFDDFESTSQVTQALALTVTGGEQETSFARFKYMMKDSVVNVLQPDLVYNGGFLRTLRVLRVAQKAQIPVTVHNARLGFDVLYMAQISCFLRGNYQEYNARKDPPLTWFSPQPRIRKGCLQIPSGPGFGVEIDPAFLRKTHRLSIHRI